MSYQCSCPACTAHELLNSSCRPGSTITRVNITTSYLAPMPPTSTPTSIASHPPPASITGPYFMPNPHIEWTPTPSSLIVPRSKNGHLYHQLFPLAPPTFPNFSRLPPELRLKIWALSTSNPRVIELRTWKPSNSYSPLKISAGPHSPPSVLQVNRESRLEGLRIYQLVDIGVSVWEGYDESELYIPWRYHHLNEFADREYRVRTPWRGTPHRRRRVRGVLERVMPYSPQRVYLAYDRDIVYLGPEFSSEHLEKFLRCLSPRELPGLQYLALDRKLWLRAPARHWAWEPLRNSLYALRNRPIKEVYIVPDDERKKLEDKWYYGKHDLVLKEPMWNYKFRGQVAEGKTVLDNLVDWLERVWDDGEVAGKGKGIQGVSDGSGRMSRRVPPKVSIKSVRRAGKSISDYKEGMCDIQQELGDMAAWKMWVPPSANAGSTFVNG